MTTMARTVLVQSLEPKTASVSPVWLVSAQALVLSALTLEDTIAGSRKSRASNHYPYAMVVLQVATLHTPTQHQPLAVCEVLYLEFKMHIDSTNINTDRENII